MAVVTVITMKTIHNFLDQDTIDFAIKEVEGKVAYDKWNDSRMVWPKELVAGAVIGGVIHDRASPILSEMILAALTPHVPACGVLYVHHYLWYPMSGINMHDDGGQKLFGATIYLTKVWDINWGGIFVCDDNSGKLQARYPTYNSLNLVLPGEKHMVTQISPLAPHPRYTLQIFGN